MPVTVTQSSEFVLTSKHLAVHSNTSAADTQVCHLNMSDTQVVIQVIITTIGCSYNKLMCMLISMHAAIAIDI